jgi:MFS family permease
MARVSATLSAPAAPARTADLFAPGLRGLTIGLVSTITLAALESLAIGTVMPIVAAELGDLPLYGWIYTAFFLGSMIGIVLSGGALDRVPLYRPFAVGLGLFALGLAIGGLAPSMPVLIAARFLQGLGAGSLTPTAYVAIGRCLPERLQPRMFAMLSTAWVVPGVIGPTLAAVVGQWLGWRWVFLGLIPLLVVAGGLALNALRHVPDAAPPVDHGTAKAKGDLRRLGAALVAALGAGMLVAGLGAPNPTLFVAGAVAGLALLLPAYRWLTPPGTLRLAVGVPAAVLLRGLMTFSFFAADAYVALLLQTWRGTPATLTGLVFTATTVAWTAGTWWQARRIDRIGPRRFVAAGFTLIAVGGLLTLPVVLAGAPPEITVLTWSIPGLGMGLMYSAVTLVVLRGVEGSEQGSASSSLQLSDILGVALGAGVAGAITAAGTRSGPDGLGPALAAVIGLSIATALLGALASGRVGTFTALGNRGPAAVD